MIETVVQSPNSMSQQATHQGTQLTDTPETEVPAFASAELVDLVRPEAGHQRRYDQHSVENDHGDYRSERLWEVDLSPLPKSNARTCAAYAR